MEKVRIYFRNKEIELESDNPKQVKDFAFRYNQRLNSFGSPLKVSDIKVALVTGIKMEYEIEQLKAKLEEANESIRNAQNTSESQKDANNELSETLDHLALYLNSISEKLENA